jgi:glucose-6-phosphate 1-dehydrogenase
MNPDRMEEPQVCRLSDARKAVDPCSMVIFGASGDLTFRKLIPALYHDFKEKLLPTEFRVVGFARREKTTESWRAELRQALEQFSRTKRWTKRCGARSCGILFLIAGRLG